jgi:hypothetical protein
MPTPSLPSLVCQAVVSISTRARWGHLPPSRRGHAGLTSPRCPTGQRTSGDMTGSAPVLAAVWCRSVGSTWTLEPHHLRAVAHHTRRSWTGSVQVCPSHNRSPRETGGRATHPTRAAPIPRSSHRPVHQQSARHWLRGCCPRGGWFDAPTGSQALPLSTGHFPPVGNGAHLSLFCLTLRSCPADPNIKLVKLRRAL